SPPAPPHASWEARGAAPRRRGAGPRGSRRPASWPRTAQPGARAPGPASRSCRRYAPAARSENLGLHAAEQRQRAILHDDLGAGADGALRGPFAGRERDLPPGPEPAGGERERDRIGVGVQEQQEGVVHDLLAVLGAGGDLVAVQEDPERPPRLLLPVALRHPAAVRAEPPHIRQARTARLRSGEERRAAEHGMLAAQPEEVTREFEQGGVGVLPVEPRELGVLAPGVVVAVLCATELVAAEQHGDALREHERREEVALLPR